LVKIPASGFEQAMINKCESNPFLLILGIQKAGTTTLFDMLNRIPGFCGSNEKETGFFIKDKFYNQGPEWYLRQFPKCSRADIKFEAKPAYIYYPNAPKRIYSFNKHMKFIVVLREPAARCYSAWNMFRRFNESSPNRIFEQFTQHSNPSSKDAISNLLFTEHFPSFKQAVEEDINRYLSRSIDIEPSFVRRGIYFEQIANYLKYFSLDDFLFLEQRELNLPVALLQKISNFLNVAIDVSSFNNPISRNVGDYLDMGAENEETLLLLRDFYKPHNEALFSQIGIRYDWNESALMR
jgi:hypothetical protein